jgi:hypothetical protein
MSILRDQDWFSSTKLSLQNPNINPIKRSKYLPHLETLYSRKDTTAPPICYDNEKTIIKKSSYYHSLLGLLQTYIHQHVTDPAEFSFGLSPIVRSSIQVATGAIESQITIQRENIQKERLKYSCKLWVQGWLYEQEPFFHALDQLIISMEEAFSLKLYDKVVENLTALKESADFPNALEPHANIADLLFFLWCSCPCPVIAVTPLPHRIMSIPGLKALDGTYISHPALERIPIIPIGTDKEGPSFVLSRHAIEIIYHDKIEVCFKRLGDSTRAEYVLTARLHYYASINPLLIKGVANTQEALKRIAA